MKHFQLCWHGHQNIAGAIHVHARLKALRPSGWTIVGVFSLTQNEWNELTDYCRQLGIPVVHDVEESAVPS